MGLIALAAAIGTSWPSPRCCCTWPDTAWPKPSPSSPPDISCTPHRHPDHRRTPSPPACHCWRTVRPRHRGPARLPTAALFASEIGIARAGTTTGLGWVTAAAFTLVVLAFAAITAHTGRMLLGPPPHPTTPGPTIAGAGDPPTPHPAAALPLIAGLLGVAALGITLAPSPTSCTPPPPFVEHHDHPTNRKPTRRPAAAAGGNPPATTASPSPPPPPLWRSMPPP